LPAPSLEREALTPRRRFNVDCEASEGLYGAAEGAFGSSGGSGDGGGSCPAAAPGSPDECAGALSTCWSPGQQDTDCPNNGLCCVSNAGSRRARAMRPSSHPASPDPPHLTFSHHAHLNHPQESSPLAPPYSASPPPNLTLPHPSPCLTPPLPTPTPLPPPEITCISV
jgi:hypothetical protein